MITTVKKWLSTVVTILLLFVLFGLIFVRLEIVELTETFFLELAIVIALTTIVRFFWYNEGEERAMGDDDIQLIKRNYKDLVDTTITSQDDLDDFVEELNTQNRNTWVLRKLKGKTSKNCPNYQSIKQKLEEKSYTKVPVITATQILTRSTKYETINATDYTKFKKLFYQTTSVFISVGMTIILGILAYKELLLNWENVFRYLTYVFSIVWALITSLWSGYKNYKTTTVDHISRLTMIVNRYGEWKATGGKKCQQDQLVISQTSSKTIPQNNKA